MAADASVEMAEHARAAVEMVRAEYGHELDFSEPTIGAIEALLNRIAKEGSNTDDLYATAALLFGSYMGEVVRAQWPEATWSAGSLTPDAPPPMLRVGEVEVSPVVWCYKRLHNGPTDSVVKRYLAFRQTLEETD